MASKAGTKERLSILPLKELKGLRVKLTRNLLSVNLQLRAFRRPALCVTVRCSLGSPDVPQLVKLTVPGR